MNFPLCLFQACLKSYFQGNNIFLLTNNVKKSFFPVSLILLKAFVYNISTLNIFFELLHTVLLVCDLKGKPLNSWQTTYIMKYVIVFLRIIVGFGHTFYWSQFLFSKLRVNEKKIGLLTYKWKWLVFLQEQYSTLKCVFLFQNCANVIVNSP